MGNNEPMQSQDVLNVANYEKNILLVYSFIHLF